jgi:hypothetical protein
VVFGSGLARIFLEFKLELALFCQLYLIIASLALTIGALITGDEREQCPLKSKLPHFPRGGFKPWNSIRNTICPVLVELQVFLGDRVLPHAGQILNRGDWCGFRL